MSDKPKKIDVKCTNCGQTLVFHDCSDKIFEVDGIFFQRDKDILVMSYKVGGIMHKFRIEEKNAVKMAESLGDIYLSKN